MKEKENDNTSSIIKLSDKLAKSAHAIHVVNKLITESKSRSKFEGKLLFTINGIKSAYNSKIDFDFYKHNLVYYYLCEEDNESENHKYKIVIWDLIKQQEDSNFDYQRKRFFGIRVKPNSTLAVVIHSLDVIDLSKKIVIGCLSNSSNFYNHSEFTHDGKYFVTVSYRGQLTIWETTDWKQVYFAQVGMVTSLSFDHTDSFLFLVKTHINPTQNVPEIQILNSLPFQIHIFTGINIINVIVEDGVHYLIMDMERGQCELDLVNQTTNTVEGTFKLPGRYAYPFVFDDSHSELITIEETTDDIDLPMFTDSWIKVWEIKGMRVKNRLTLSTVSPGIIKRNREFGYLCCSTDSQIEIWH